MAKKVIIIGAGIGKLLAFRDVGATTRWFTCRGDDLPRHYPANV